MQQSFRIYADPCPWQRPPKKTELEPHYLRRLGISLLVFPHLLNGDNGTFYLTGFLMQKKIKGYKF